MKTALFNNRKQKLNVRSKFSVYTTMHRFPQACPSVSEMGPTYEIWNSGRNLSVTTKNISNTANPCLTHSQNQSVKSQFTILVTMASISQRKSVFFFPLTNELVRGWRDGSAIKSICCSYEELGLVPSIQVRTNSLLYSFRAPTLSSGFCRYCVNVVHIHTRKQTPIYINPSTQGAERGKQISEFKASQVIQ